MAARSNALSELVRLWLEARHGCALMESVPVAVPYATSDIDFLALRPTLSEFALRAGTNLRPRLMVEVKDEHDYDPQGSEACRLLAKDVEQLGPDGLLPDGVKPAKFSMLRREHWAVAAERLGSAEIDRVFVLHAVNAQALASVHAIMTRQRVFVLGVREVVSDLAAWYAAHPRKAALRHTLTGDLFHLLFGFCGVRMDADGVRK